MRRVLLICLAVAMVFAAGTASAQWNLGLRLVGTGNYFPYLPSVGGDGALPITDAGLYGFKELVVGYGTDMLCLEGSFAYDNFGSTFTDDEDVEREDDLTWWYVGGTVLYKFLKGDGYSGSAGLRYQYGASSTTQSATYDAARITEELTMKGTTNQISVPVRFMWRPGGGKFAIGPEIAFKYTMGTTELEYSVGSQALSTDGPEFNGFDTEYSLMMKFVF